MPNDFIQESRQTSLVFWVTGQMMKGAGYAAAFVIAIALIIWAIYLVGLLLPAQSREMPSPYTLMLERPALAEPHALA